MKILLLTSAALLLASPALADKMVNNPLTPSEYKARVLTLNVQYAQKEKELAALESEELAEACNKNNNRKIQAGLPAEIDSAPQKVNRARVLTLDEEYQQRKNELAALESRIAEACNKNNSRKIQAGLPAEIDSAPQKVRLLMERGTIRVWPAPRAFTTVIVGSEELDAKPSDAGNADLVISAQKKGYGNIILTDEQGKVIADIQVQVVDTMPREEKGSDRAPLQNLMVEVPPSNRDGK
jgi:Pilus formation protein N terminal region